MLYEVIVPSGAHHDFLFLFLKEDKVDFKFELDGSNNNLYGTVDLGATDGVSPFYRIAIRSSNSLTEARGGVFSVFIEQHAPLYGTSYWSKLKYRRLLNLDKDFVVELKGQIIPADFDWVTFYFTRTEDGLFLKKVGKPIVIDANGLGNLNLDRMVLQEGLVLNNFQIIVINNLVGRDKKYTNTKDNRWKLIIES